MKKLTALAALAAFAAFAAIEPSKWGLTLTPTGTPTADDIAAMRATVDQENARRQTVELVNGGNPATPLPVEPTEKLVESYKVLVQATVDRLHRQAVETAYITRLNAEAQQKAFAAAVEAAIARHSQSTTNATASK